MVHYLLNWFVAVSFCLVFVSFAFCYTFVPMVSYRKNGQMRSLSGIMKASDYKPYFSTVMGCLGGSLFLSVGMRSYQEDTNFKQNVSFLCGLAKCEVFDEQFGVQVEQSQFPTLWLKSLAEINLFDGLQVMVTNS